jgi:hypothetical protein
MTHPTTHPADATNCPSELATRLQSLPPGRRGAALQMAVSFRPDDNHDQLSAVGPIRAAFADFWEARFGQRVPVEGLRALLEPPLPIAVGLVFNRFILMRQVAEIESALGQLTDFLQTKLCERGLGRSDWPDSATPVSPDRIAKPVN